MNSRQRENTAKCLYDLCKGTILIAVVGNLVGGIVNRIALLIGACAAVGLYLWALYVDRGDK
jgi:hypothetical protein